MIVDRGAALHRIVYMSRALLSLGTGYMEVLLNQSRRNNARDGITGLLLSDGKCFLQIIEGEQEKVEQCYARIAVDPRHHRVIRVIHEPASDREFPDWNLSYRQVDVADNSEFRAAVHRDVATVSNIHLRALLLGFARLSR